MSSRNNPARVAIVMGSKSDWATMQFAAEIFEILNVPHHVEVVSAHRTPDKLFSFAESAEENGYEVIIAGAGGAAHLPGMIAAKTLVPVLGVPVQSAALSGVDSLYSIVQMPRGSRLVRWPLVKRVRQTLPYWRANPRHARQSIASASAGLA
jgi:5-(carboxyamino)imidazole ribonucleotide mutase